MITEDKEILNVLSIKYNLPASKIEHIIEHSLKCVSDCIKKDDMPDILIHGLGRFKANKTIFERKFVNMLSFLEKDPDNISKINISQTKKLFSVYERIVTQEKETVSISYLNLKKIINESK